MKNWLKKNWMIVAVVLVILVAIIALLIPRNKKTTTDSNQGETTITPTSMANKPTGIIAKVTAPAAASVGYGPVSSQSEIDKQKAELAQNRKDYPLVSLLPYKGDNFRIDHYRAPKTIVVVIESEAVQKEVEAKVNAWLLKYGETTNKDTIIWEIGKL